MYGLVPPATIETAAKCTNGVARVETQSSFLNMVASTLTFGIYTPMQLDVTCAACSTTDAQITGGILKSCLPTQSIARLRRMSR
ncbi:MAG: Bor/Iss family lipoprotein [Gemmatimonadaceae bacterium]